MALFIHLQFNTVKYVYTRKRVPCVHFSILFFFLLHSFSDKVLLHSLLNDYLIFPVSMISQGVIDIERVGEMQESSSSRQA